MPQDSRGDAPLAGPAPATPAEPLPRPGTTLTWAVVRSYYPSQRPGNYIRPLPEHGVVYVKNPKAACSTLVLWLDRIHTGDLDRRFDNVHKENRLPRIEDVGRRRAVRMLRGGGYSFSFVRHPVSRFESAYRDKIVRAGWAPKVQPFLGIPADRSQGLSFEQFLEGVERQDPLTQMDPHWRPQHINLLHPVVTFSRVGRLESFDTDLAAIREEAGLPAVPYQSRNLSKSRDAGSVYDGRPDLVRRVEELYAVDMELYGY
jgi:hypothetical protein